MKRVVVTSFVLLSAVAPVRADIVVTGVELPRDPSGRPLREEKARTVYISPRGVRIDEEGLSHLVDARNKVLLELDHRAHTARRMTFKELGDMTGRARKEADDAVALARDQLDALPTEVRVKVEAAMRAQRSALEARKPGAYKRQPTGNKRTVNGFECEDVKEVLNGEWVGSACVHRGVRLPDPDRKMLERLAKDMAAAGVAGAQDPFSRAFLDGIPVEMSSRHPATGELVVEERVTKIEARPIADSMFDVPAGYRTLAWEAPRAPSPPAVRR